MLRKWVPESVERSTVRRKAKKAGCGRKEKDEEMVSD